MFVDFVKIYVKAGDGGNGAITFHREKYIPYGGPDGGDAGNGGDIIFLADRHINTLAKFRFKKNFYAKNGEDGKKNNCHGKNGEDLTIKVPLGTLIKDAKTGAIIADICDFDPVIVAKGGRGGWGNTRFKNSIRKTPRFAKPGTEGEEFELELELKLLADVGLIGLPNVGKSTLISVVSAARPKIGNYNFTTLKPCLGVVDDADFSFVIADIPGLVKGASKGKGLGHQFLRHIQRCRILVHVVDVSCFLDSDPIEDFLVVNRELENFDESLKEKMQIIVANKCDVLENEKVEKLSKYAKDNKFMFFKISSVTRMGLKELIYELKKQLLKLPKIKFFDLDYANVSSSSEKNFNSKNFEIKEKDGVFHIESKWLKKIINMMDLDDLENLKYFERLLNNFE